MENDLKSKIKDLESTIDKVIEEAMRNIRPEDIHVDLEKMKRSIERFEGIGREERIAKLATNLVASHASLVFYSGCGTAYLEGKKPLYMQGLQDNVKEYLKEAKEFEYLPTIKTLSDALAAEVKKREQPVTI